MGNNSSKATQFSSFLDPQSAEKKEIDEQINKDKVHLSSPNIGDKEMLYLFSNPKTQNLVELQLYTLKIKSSNFCLFPTAKWNKLNVLYIQHSLIGNKGCKRISQAEMPLLRELYLKENQIESAGVIHLFKVKWAYLPKLNLSSSVYFDTGRIGELGIGCITRGNWANIETIQFNACNLTDTEALRMVLSELKRVSYLSVCKLSKNKGRYWSINTKKNETLIKILSQKFIMCIVRA